MESTFQTIGDVWMLAVIRQWACKLVCPGFAAFFLTNLTELCDRLLSEASVWINPGTMYGPETGKGYVRFNIACPRSRLQEALNRIAEVI